MMDWLHNFAASVPIGWRGLLDISLVTIVYYRVLILVRGTRAVSVIHGIVVVLLAYYVSDVAGLTTLHWLLANFLGSFFLILVILFQADLRRALSQVGVSWFGGRKSGARGRDMATSLAAGLQELARRRIGALVVLERGMPLGDIIDRGVKLRTALTLEMLLTIFHHESPLHDGALVVQGFQIAAASCVLPLTANRTLPTMFGTRHRAAVGVSEESDALVLVVSEERGDVRAAQDGKLSEPMDGSALTDLLLTKWARS